MVAPVLPRPHLLALLALAAAAARADELPASAGLADVVGPRALGLAAATGVASGNDGMFVNPAAVAARRRYSLETLYAVDRRGGSDAGRYLGASVVDSLSAPVTVSLGYLRPVEGPQRGNLFLFGLAGPISEKLYLGAQARYLAIQQPDLTGTTTERISAVTADAGLFWEVSDYISVGASGFNLLPIGHKTAAPPPAPRTVGAGLALGSDTSFKVMADWRATLEGAQGAKTTNRYSAGAEVLLGGVAPLRAGFQKDETLKTSWWTLGFGLVSSSGAALDVGYKQSVSRPDARVLAASFKLQFLQL
jgi:hypothetical protein